MFDVSSATGRLTRAALCAAGTGVLRTCDSSTSPRELPCFNTAGQTPELPETKWAGVSWHAEPYMARQLFVVLTILRHAGAVGWSREKPKFVQQNLSLTMMLRHGCLRERRMVPIRIHSPGHSASYTLLESWRRMTVASFWASVAVHLTFERLPRRIRKPVATTYGYGLLPDSCLPPNNSPR